MATASAETLQIADGLRLRVFSLASTNAMPRRISIIKGDATSGNITLTLPPASENAGQMVMVKKSDASGNFVTIAGAGADLIDGVASFPLTRQYEGVTMYSDGTNWMIQDPVGPGDFNSIYINQPADASGTPLAGLTYVAGAHTNVANAEQFDVNLNLARTVTFVGGGAPITQQRAMVVQAPTYASVAAQTITTAATLTVANAPTQGTNVTITNSRALWIQAGTSQFDGPITGTDTATNSIGVRNGVNAQTFSVYNTFAAGTPDYERLSLLWSGNTAIIRAEKNGTGTSRSLAIQYGGTSTNAIIVSTGVTGGIFLGTASTASATAGGTVIFGNGATFSSVSSTNILCLVNPIFSDGGATSTTVSQCLAINPTINYTAASRTGKVVLAYFAPTLTSQPSGKNAGISFSSAFTSSTFPAMVFQNQADEDTNYERYEQGWHLYANIYSMQVTKGGTGTARALNLYYSSAAAGTSSAISIPITVGNTINLGPTGGTGLGTATNAVGIGTGGNFVYTATSGTASGLNLGLGFSPSSTSTMSCYGIAVQPTINYSNGTPGAGYVYGIYVAPVNTALPTGRSAGIALSSTASALSTGCALVFNNQVDEQTNFEQFAMGFTSNVLLLQSIAGGTGTVRNIQVTVANAAGTAVTLFQATSTITGTVADGQTAGLQLTPTYNAGSAQTVTRHNYIKLSNPSLGGVGPAANTDSCVFWFDANAGTHKAVDSGTTKTSPGTVTQWIKINVNGVVNYIPSYSSKTT